MLLKEMIAVHDGLKKNEEQAAATSISKNEEQAAATSISKNEEQAAATSISKNEEHAAATPISKNEKQTAATPTSKNEEQAAITSISKNEEPVANTPISKNEEHAANTPISKNEEQTAATPISKNEEPAAITPISKDEEQTATTPISAAPNRNNAGNRLRKTGRKSGTVTGVARVPPPHLMEYSTAHYELYNHESPQKTTPVPGAFIKFANYDHYTLYVNPGLQSPLEVPTSGVRLDDLTISKVMKYFLASDLNKNWPAEFDVRGMIRATRVPMGAAAKVWVDVGAIDVNGDVLALGEEGYYYEWWRGLHCLCGGEGLNAGIYKIRPSFEKFLCHGFTWKKGFKAVLQLDETLIAFA